MKTVLRVVLTLLAGIALGLGLTALAITSPPHLGTVNSGPWQARMRLGTPEADPYARAVLAMRGEIPMGAVEGLSVTAGTDSSGRALTGQCSYRVSGQMPAANHWTLTVHRRSGVAAPPGLRTSYTSSEALHGENAQISLMLSAEPQAGNWIPLPAGEEFDLALRLYETQISTSAPVLDRLALPLITRGDCR